MLNSIFVTVLIEGCSSVRMDEGGIEPFSKAGGTPLCVFISYLLFFKDGLEGRLFGILYPFQRWCKETRINNKCVTPTESIKACN